MGTVTNIGPCGCCGGAPNCQSLLITYDWGGTGVNDLDTGTTFLGTTVGWDCGNGNAYIEFGGDSQATNGQEVVTINFWQAFLDGLWSSSTTVNLAAGWFTGDNGSGPALVRVRCLSGGTEYTKVIYPGAQDTCASTNVGSVTIYQNGSFSLS